MNPFFRVRQIAMSLIKFMNLTLLHLFFPSKSPKIATKKLSNL